jgi:hypothetical protein
MIAAIVGMRLNAYLRGYYAIAPAVAGLVVLATLYGGGVTRPEEAYGVSALVLFPVLAWQAQILFDAEPDVQRRLIRLAAGTPAREISTGLLAAAVSALPTLGLAMFLPWVFRSVGPVPLQDGVVPLGLGATLAFGVWAHLLVVPAAVVLGGFASRAIAGRRAVGVVVLVVGSLVAILVGLEASPVPWLAPPLMAIARAANHGVSAAGVWWLTVWAAAWSAAAIAVYWRWRIRRP